MWKGTLATLNPNPTSNRPTPSTGRSAASPEGRAATAAEMRPRVVLPLTP
jgi:hypothetical protein